MNERKIKGGIFHRTFSFERSAVNEQARTIEVAFSSEAPVERWFGYEILDHTPASVDLTRIRGGGPVLVNHDSNDQVGVVDSAVVESDRKGRASLRFGSSARAEEIWQDVKDGIRKSISVGYRVFELVTEKVENGVETMRAVKWMPLEISIVPIPADASVGVGRSDSEAPNDIVVRSEMKRILLNPTATDGGGAAAPGTVITPAATTTVTGNSVEDVRKGELRRASEIRNIAKRTANADLMNLAEAAIANGTSIEDFRREAFETVCRGARQIDLGTMPSQIGMSAKEVKRYSMLRALHRLSSGKPVEGLEAEASDAVAKRLGRTPEGFFIPMDVQLEQRNYPQLDTRELNSTTGSAGGYVVATNLLSGSLIELLRNRMVTVQLGATPLSGLVGNIAIPRQSGGATAYWLAETATVTASQQTLAQLGLTPHRLAATTAYTKTLLAQGSLDVENFVRSDLFTTLAIEKDKAAIQGSGAAGEPLGILSTSGLSTGVTFAAGDAPTWAELVKFETNVSNSNADIGRLAYAVTPTARGRLKTTAKVTNQAFFIWEPDPQGRPGWGLVNGYPAVASKQIPDATNVLFGNWSDLIVADWDGVDITVDPYSLSTSNQVRVVVQILTDSGLRHAASFSASINAIS